MSAPRCRPPGRRAKAASRPWINRAMGLLGVLLTCGASGCTALVPQRTAPPEGQIPAEFSLGVAVRNEEHRWWEDFASEELDALIEEAFRENLTMRQLWARLDQAGSLVTQAGSGLYPQLDLNSGASLRRSYTSVDNLPTLRTRLRSAVIEGINRGLNNVAGSAIGGNLGQEIGNQQLALGRNLIDITPDRSPRRISVENQQYGLGLAAGYELDLWGRIASQYRAARLDFIATRNDLEAVAVTLASEVATRWLQILELQELQRVLREQLETNRTYLDLVEFRYGRGLVSALDIYQQRQIVKQVEQQLPLAEAQEQVLRHDLAVLIGRPPRAELMTGTYDLDRVPELPSIGIPADLLRFRPDVRAALASLEASDQRVASARAELLPTIRLTGGIGYNAAQFANLFDDWFLSVAGDLAQPLFDGFRRIAEVERRLAATEELLANYRLIVLTAIREVEDALIQERKHREHLAALSEQLDAAANALREAGQRYQAGLSDYLPVLTALERTQSLTRTLVVTRRELLVFRINLYRALGGTWVEQLSAPAPLNATADAKDVSS